MKRFARPVILGATVLAFGVAGTMVASAWTVSTNKVNLKVRAAKMPKGVTPSTAIQSSSAVVSWSAQEIVPGVKMKAYVVTAHDISAARHPDVIHTMTASGSSAESSTFTRAELGTGRYRWTIMPKFEQWTGDEGKQSSALTFPATPASASADALAAAANATSPASGPIAPSPGSSASATAFPAVTPPTENVPDQHPTTSAPEKTAAPEKTESPKADPTPSGTDSAPAS